MPLKGKRDRASIYVVQTRLGWMVSYDYQYPDHGGVGGGGIAPPMDLEGMYIWHYRQAAIQYGAHCLLNGAVHPTPGQTIDARAKIGKVVKAFFDELGIDATVQPTVDRRRRIITKARIEDLRAAASEAA